MNIKEEPVDLGSDEEKLQKAREIIRSQFLREVEERENEVIAIQEQIQSTQHYLEGLKYVASYEYYGQRDDVKTEDGEPSSEHAIHPCVQKFLPPQMAPSEEPQIKPVEEEMSLPETQFTQKPKQKVTIVRGTYKVKHQIVVGNVSKWIPPSAREDQATHKWMLYVRDKDRDNEMGKIIKKVRYFLHESYKPHDIIDVTSNPFHLTRRGWGEFPVRVTIYFQHSANKPVDFIHQLKLDHSFAGIQLLGGETIIEVDLIHENMDELIGEEPVAENSSKIISKLSEIIALEHDYCSNRGEPSEQSQPCKSRPISSQLLTNVADISEVDILNKWRADKDGPIAKWYKKEMLARGTNIYFFSTEACVKWFLKRWPIVTSLGVFTRYKIVHPYSFPTMETFLRANVGRRRAAEWYRAWKIREMLQALNLTPWTTKQVMLYARMHGYVYFTGKAYFMSPSARFSDISTYTNNVDTSSNLRQLQLKQQDEEIDILSEVLKVKPTTPVKLTKHYRTTSSGVDFVEAVSKQIGVRFGDEEIVDGISTNASAVVLAQTLKLFLDDLLRKSFSNSWLRNNCRNPGSLEVQDVLKCIVDLPEFEVLTNAGLGSKTSSV